MQDSLCKYYCSKQHWQNLPLNMCVLTLTSYKLGALISAYSVRAISAYSYHCMILLENLSHAYVSRPVLPCVTPLVTPDEPSYLTTPPVYAHTQTTPPGPSDHTHSHQLTEEGFDPVVVKTKSGTIREFNNSTHLALKNASLLLMYVCT